jgi:hypothetical protein
MVLTGRHNGHPTTCSPSLPVAAVHSGTSSLRYTEDRQGSCAQVRPVPDRCAWRGSGLIIRGFGSAPSAGCSSVLDDGLAALSRASRGLQLDDSLARGRNCGQLPNGIDPNLVRSAMVGSRLVGGVPPAGRPHTVLGIEHQHEDHRVGVPAMGRCQRSGRRRPGGAVSRRAQGTGPGRSSRRGKAPELSHRSRLFTSRRPAPPSSAWRSFPAVIDRPPDLPWARPRGQARRGTRRRLGPDRRDSDSCSARAAARPSRDTPAAPGPR